VKHFLPYICSVPPNCSWKQCYLEAAKNGMHEIKILSYNIRNARGMDEKTDYDRIAGIIRSIHPDCAALQELDSATARSNGEVILDELAKRTGMYASYSKSIDYQGGGYGIGILTKEKPPSQRSHPPARS